jgi:hypothetical protein
VRYPVVASEGREEGREGTDEGLAPGVGRRRSPVAGLEGRQMKRLSR